MSRQIVVKWDEDFIARIDNVAEHRHVTRNDLLKEAARQLVETHEHEQNRRHAELEAIRNGTISTTSEEV